MTRFVVLQNRYQTATLAAVLLLVAIVAAVTGPHLSDLYGSTVATCRVHGDCGSSINALVQNDSILYHVLDLAMLFLPGLVGLFWGAPLVARELESGTYRLAWTQSVTRTRWLVTKLAVAGATVVVLTGICSLAVTWWSRPIDLANADQFLSFDQRDIVPMGYAAFAFALGAALGLVIKRVVPAMLATLGTFIGGRFAFETWVRPYLAPISHEVLDLASRSKVDAGLSQSASGINFIISPANINNADIVSSSVVNAGGQSVPASSLRSFIASHCPALVHPPAGNSGAGPAGAPAVTAFNNCLTKLSSTYHQAVSYIKPSDYWSMQWYETALFLMAAAALAAVSVLAVRRASS